MKIFHITVATLVGTIAVFGGIIASAPSRGGEAAKTNPAVAAPPISPAPTTGPSTDNPALLDRCEYLARRKLPGAMQDARVCRVWKQGAELIH